MLVTAIDLPADGARPIAMSTGASVIQPKATNWQAAGQHSQLC